MDGEAGQDAHVDAVVLIEDVFQKRGLEAPAPGAPLPFRSHQDFGAEIRQCPVGIGVTAKYAGLGLELADPGESPAAREFVGRPETPEVRGLEFREEAPVPGVDPSGGSVQALSPPAKRPFRLNDSMKRGPVSTRSMCSGIPPAR